MIGLFNVPKWVMAAIMPPVFGFLQFLPLIIAAAKKGYDAYSKSKHNKQKGEATKEAAQELYDARKQRFGEEEQHRATRLSGINTQLQRMGGVLGEGAPDYSFDPETLAQMQKARSYSETPGSLMSQVQGDPTKGTGNALMEGFMSAAGAGANAYMAGGGGVGPSTFQMPDKGAAEADMVNGGQPSAPDINWDDLFTQSGLN